MPIERQRLSVKVAGHNEATTNFVIERHFSRANGPVIMVLTDMLPGWF